nr:phloem protein 2-like protein [Tanacetum cinerariifolium]
MVDGLVQIDDKNRVGAQPSDKLQLVDLLTPTDIPVIRQQLGESRDIPLRPRKIKGHPKLRKDGWMEIQIWDFKTGTSHDSISMNCRVKSYDKWNFTGLLVQASLFQEILKPMHNNALNSLDDDVEELTIRVKGANQCKADLTWAQLLRICHGAACGLNYLHDPMGMHQRVLHRDVKSSNILLNEDFTAKISDFGLSKIGPANQQFTYLISNIAGTQGYCDPELMSEDFNERAEYKELISIAKQNISPISGISTPIIGKSKAELELILSKGIFVVDAGEH